VALEIKPALGIVDVRLFGVIQSALRKVIGDQFEPGITTANAKKPSSLHSSGPKLKAREPHEAQIDSAKALMAAADRLEMQPANRRRRQACCEDDQCDQNACQRRGTQCGRGSTSARLRAVSQAARRRVDPALAQSMLCSLRKEDFSNHVVKNENKN
jgi:hypothetical protein